MNKLFEKGPRNWIWILVEVTRVTWETDDHLQKASPSGWSFARGQSLRMIICNRPVLLDDRLQEAYPTQWLCARRGWSLQEAGPSWWSFARSRPLSMIICKRSAPLDDYLQGASPSRWSFARGLSLWIIICKRPAPHFDNHDKGVKIAFLRPFTMRKDVFWVSKNPISMKKIKIFTFAYGQGQGPP